MPPIQIDKILSDPLLVVSAVLLVVSPILFLIALVKYLRTPQGEPFAIPHHEMESPIPTPKEVEEPAEEHGLAPAAPVEPPPLPAAPSMPATPPPPTPPRPHREESAAEKTVVMPPGLAEMQSEMEIALTQLRLLNKRVANLEQELARLRGSSGGSPNPPTPL